MDIGLQLWGQFVEWDELMDAGKLVERLGFSSLWSNDHFYPSFGAEDGPVLEGWITLVGFAVLTERITLGCMVSGAAYRNPALLVKMATTVDHASHGRLTLGLGAGWHEREHRAFGYALLGPGARIARLAEAAEVARGLLAGGPVTFKGTQFSVDGARNDPPAYGGRRMPILIGGSGEKLTLAVVARYADVWNGEGDPAAIARKIAVLAEHCRAAGRDPGEIRITVGMPTPCVRASRADALTALAATYEHHGLGRAAALAAAETSPCVGTRDEVVAILRAYAEIGVSEVIFDTPHPLDHATLKDLSGPIHERLRRAP
jgi:alkanesulfonate monooxygenase SsuD/methylene tetrahydromethanopterin reductase-like flavin-dependent oxidoreductase (luciferase family)